MLIYIPTDCQMLIPLTAYNHQIANKYSRQQLNPQKAKQVYLNLLAVSAVDFYLQCLGISTDIEASYSHNPALFSLQNVADLQISKLGHLECRPMLANEQVLKIPQEVWQNRIGYMAVQFNESLTEATILGFILQPSQEEIGLDRLQSLDYFLEYLEKLSLAAAQNSEEVRANAKLVKLNQWIEKVFEVGWENLERVMKHPQEYAIVRKKPIEADRPNDDITRGKLIDLGIQLADRPVVLIVSLLSTHECEREIRLVVRSAGNYPYLPEKLQLTVLDAEGNEVLQAQAREADNWIQLEFTGEIGEYFSVSLALGEISMVEEFII